MRKIVVNKNGRKYLVTIPFDDVVPEAGNDGGIAQPEPIIVGPIVGWSIMNQLWNTTGTAWNVS